MLLFRKTRFVYTDTYGCVQTNRIVRIQRDGGIVYGERGCRERKRVEFRDSMGPFTVPAADAVGIRRGASVIGLTGRGGTGVLRVLRANKIVRLRGDRVVATSGRQLRL